MENGIEVLPGIFANVGLRADRNKLVEVGNAFDGNLHKSTDDFGPNLTQS